MKDQNEGPVNESRITFSKTQLLSVGYHAKSLFSMEAMGYSLYLKSLACIFLAGYIKLMQVAEHTRTDDRFGRVEVYHYSQLIESVL